jgi:hypothetical protein
MSSQLFEYRVQWNLRIECQGRNDFGFHNGLERDGNDKTQHDAHRRQK